MKTAAVIILMVLLFNGSLQDAETPDPKLDINVEIINMREKITELWLDIRILQMDSKDIEAKLTDIEMELKNQKAPKIAFSAALARSVGQFDVDFTLVYDRVITNVGQAYNPVTGIFTAPVNGSYYFRFTSCGNTGYHGMAIELYKNNVRMTGLAKVSDGYMTYFSGGLVLQLETGDAVYTKLPTNSKLYDDVNNRSTFSGFLLFPM